jgi:ATP-dependent protease HslVU (ClpYQ) peptidase subunit
MTAEVAVLNTTGVALAADSAVTIGEDATKIYTSAEKLFQLSNSAPVGAMIYGSASLVGLPWETTIKAYRKKLSDKTLPAIEDSDIWGQCKNSLCLCNYSWRRT